ncbi:DhNV_086 [Dikerogammarus haemobaphes nudivirus]|nr:DhNV_086 [Dikerogammarus haemobaphes nudivirus]
MSSIHRVVKLYIETLNKFSKNLETFQANILGRMQYILNQTTKIKVKNWDEIQLIYKIRNDIEKLHLKFKSDIEKDKKSIQFAFNKIHRITFAKRGIKYSRLYIVQKTLWCNDKISNLTKGTLKNTNYTMQLDLQEAKLKTFTELKTPNSITTSNFIKPNITYNGDTVENIVEKVIYKLNATEKLTRLVQSEPQGEKVAAETANYLETVNLEILSLIDRIYQRLTNLDEVSKDTKKSKTPTFTVPQKLPFLDAEMEEEIEGNTDDEQESDDEFLEEGGKLFSDDEDDPMDGLAADDGFTYDDFDVKTLTFQNQKSNSVVNEISKLKEQLGTLVTETKFETGLNKIMESLINFQYKIALENTKQIDVNNQQQEGQEKIKDELNKVVQNIEVRIDALERQNQTNVTDLSNVKTTNDIIKNVLEQTEKKIIELFNTYNAQVNKKPIEDLMANYAKSINDKNNLIKEVGESVEKILTNNSTQSNTIKTLLLSLQEAIGKIETGNTISDYITTTMVDDIVRDLSSTNKNDIEQLTTEIITRTEKFHEKSLGILQTKYDGMFKTSKQIVNAHMTGLKTLQTEILKLVQQIKTEHNEITSLENSLKEAQAKVAETTTKLEKLDALEKSTNGLLLEKNILLQYIEENKMIEKRLLDQEALKKHELQQNMDMTENEKLEEELNKLKGQLMFLTQQTKDYEIRENALKLEYERKLATDSQSKERTELKNAIDILNLKIDEIYKELKVTNDAVKEKEAIIEKLKLEKDELLNKEPLQGQKRKLVDTRKVKMNFEGSTYFEKPKKRVLVVAEEPKFDPTNKRRINIEDNDGDVTLPDIPLISEIPSNFNFAGSEIPDKL